MTLGLGLDMAQALLCVVYDRRASTADRAEAAARFSDVLEALRRLVLGRAPHSGAELTGDPEVDSLGEHLAQAVKLGLAADPAWGGDLTRPLAEWEQPCPPAGWASLRPPA